MTAYLLGQVEEELHRLIGDAVLGVVHLQSGAMIAKCLHWHASGGS